MNDLSTDSTNKRTTTAPNNTATKGYKLENNTDDDVKLTSAHPISVLISTTEVNVKEIDSSFGVLVNGLPKDDVTFRPLLTPLNDHLIPNGSMVDPLLIDMATVTVSSPYENKSIVCQMSRDCPQNEVCIYGQCKELCGPFNHNNCFSGIIALCT